MNPLRKDSLIVWPYESCRCCGERNVIGFLVMDEVWLAVTGDEDTIWCPACFDREAQRNEIKYNFLGLFPVSWWMIEEEEKPRELSAATRKHHERLADELLRSGKDELDITEHPTYDEFEFSPEAKKVFEKWADELIKSGKEVIYPLGK